MKLSNIIIFVLSVSTSAYCAKYPQSVEDKSSKACAVKHKRCEDSEPYLTWSSRCKLAYLYTDNVQCVDNCNEMFNGRMGAYESFPEDDESSYERQDEWQSSFSQCVMYDYLTSYWKLCISHCQL
jgi:hypothetical protein